jgi:hypothetical protein
VGGGGGRGGGGGGGGGKEPVKGTVVQMKTWRILQQQQFE